MKPHWVDATIILRYLTKDDPARAPACFELFNQAAQDRVTLTTTESIVAEVVLVLASRHGYQLPAGEIKKRLVPLLSLRSLKLAQRETLLRALALFERYGLDFEACLTLAHLEQQHAEEFYSYDQDFDQVTQLKRLEPSSVSSSKKNG